MARVVIVVEEMRYAGRLETGYFWQGGSEKLHPISHPR